MNNREFIQGFKQFEDAEQRSIIFELSPSSAFNVPNGLEDPNADEAKKTLKRIFKRLLNQNIWVIFRAWETTENFKAQLVNCGLGNFSQTLTLAKKTDALVDYDLFNPTTVFYTAVDKPDGKTVAKTTNCTQTDTLTKIAHGIIHNDIGLDPYLNAGAYFVDVSHTPYLLNLPDDRTVELVFRKQDETYFNEKVKDFSENP